MKEECKEGSRRVSLRKRKQIEIWRGKRRRER
jgi:hypothetical protein